MIRINRTFRDMFGLNGDDQMVGRYNLFEDNLLEDRGLLPSIREVFDKGKTARFVLEEYDVSKIEHLSEHIDQRKETPWILDVTISPIVNADGEVTNALVQYKDIIDKEEGVGD